MKKFFHSLRWRIQAWYAMLLFIAIAAFCLTAYQLAWNNQMRRIDSELEGPNARRLLRSLFKPMHPRSSQGVFHPAHEIILQRLRSGNYQISEEVISYFQGNAPGYLYFAIIDWENDQVLLASENLPKDFSIPKISTGKTSFRNSQKNVREIIFSSPPPSTLGTVVGRDITPEKNDLYRYALSLTIAGAGLWLLGLLGGWWIAGRTIRPIRDIANTATRIAEGNLTERIKIDNSNSELAQLSMILNQTFGQLHAALERQRQFTADASHELRTPITILLSETQRALKRSRTAEEYREILQTCLDTAQRMRHLTEALILLARQESDRDQNYQASDLSSILEHSIQTFSPMAKERSINLHIDLHPAPLKGDPAALSILAANILQNAIQHHRNEGERNIYITTGTSGKISFLKISDNGPGISENDLSHIFDRFYRSDKARRTTSTTPNSGLGLAIVKMIADNHHANIATKSIWGEGTSFTVNFPQQTS